MRALTLAVVLVAGTPVLAQSDPAAPAPAPKTKRVCRFVDTGNPMQIERRCREVAVKEAPVPVAAQAAAAAAPAPAVNQVALQSPPKR